MKKLENKIALVSAATKGIGLACAETLAENGALVYLAARNEELATECIKKIEKEGGKAKFVYFNAREDGTLAKMVETVIENEGKIDILVNNYGATNVKKDFDVLNTEVEDFLEIIERNIKSVLIPSQVAIKSMIENEGGSIVNISSIGGIVPDLSRTAYATSKSAINALTKNIATQYAKKGVRCNAVLPGLTATNAALENMSEEFMDSFLAHVPLNRMGTPQDIANAVLYYASDDSSYVTGMIHPVAGGYSMPTPQYADFTKDL